MKAVSKLSSERKMTVKVPDRFKAATAGKALPIIGLPLFAYTARRPHLSGRDSSRVHFAQGSIRVLRVCCRDVAHTRPTYRKIESIAAFRFSLEGTKHVGGSRTEYRALNSSPR
jgi:hypothetical protein